MVKALLLLVLGVKCDKTAVKVEIERALVLHLPTGLLVILEDALVDFHVARLPGSEERRTIFVEESFFSWWLNSI